MNFFEDCKTLIKYEMYPVEVMKKRLDFFLLHGRLSETEYNELIILLGGAL